MTGRWLAFEAVGAWGLFMLFFRLIRPVPAAAIAVVSSTVFAQVAPLPSVVVTASRFATPLSDAPIGMTVIDRDQVAASTASNLAELLGQQVSVQVRDNAGSPDRQIDLRGFGITGDQNTLILLDGRRLNENELASTRLSAIPLVKSKTQTFNVPPLRPLRSISSFLKN